MSKIRLNCFKGEPSIQWYDPEMTFIILIIHDLLHDLLYNPVFFVSKVTMICYMVC